MGEVVDYDWDDRPYRGRPTKYPWDLWLDGSSWRLERGTPEDPKDFVLDDKSLRAAVSSAARKRNRRARVACVSEGVYVIQAYNIT